MAGLRAEEEAAWGLQGNRHSSSRSDAVVAGSTVRARALSRCERMCNSTSQLNGTGRIIIIGNRFHFPKLSDAIILTISDERLHSDLSDDRLQVNAISEGCWGWG